MTTKAPTSPPIGGELDASRVGHLPALLRDLADVVGLTVALRLAGEKGGTRVYVPASASPDHPLAAIVGIEGLRFLADRYGGTLVEVPLGPHANFGLRFRRERIRALLVAGGSEAQIARAVGCHVRTVRKVRAATCRDDPRQPRLF